MCGSVHTRVRGVGVWGWRVIALLPENDRSRRQIIFACVHRLAKKYSADGPIEAADLPSGVGKVVRLRPHNVVVFSLLRGHVRRFRERRERPKTLLMERILDAIVERKARRPGEI